MIGNGLVTDRPVVRVTRQGLELRNPTSGWPFALSVGALAVVVSIVTLGHWHSATDARSLLLTLLLAGAATVGGRFAFTAAGMTLVTPPLHVYVVSAAILAGPLAAIVVGVAAGAATLISPPQGQLFSAGMGALQGAAAAAVAAQFDQGELSRALPTECAAVAATAAVVWISGQALLFLARDIPIRRLWRLELPSSAGEFVVALAVAPAIITLDRGGSLLAVALLTAVMLGGFAAFRSYRRRLFELNAQMEQLSRIDPLTGAANRRAFTERLGQERSRATRSGRPFALLLFDLDDFKQLNDTYGHPAGDHVLGELTRKLRGRLRREDMLARIGGDEFAVIATEATDHSAVEALAALITATAREPVPHRQQEITVSVSVGATLADGQLEPEQLLRRADEALYQTKRSGRS